MRTRIEANAEVLKNGIDVITLLEADADHGISASSFNALPRPGMLLVKREQAEVIKVAKTIQHGYKHDCVPELVCPAAD